MAETDEIPWVLLSVVAGGALVVGYLVRGVVRVALDEASYRANVPRRVA